MKYTPKQINKFRDTISDAIDYADDAGDEALVEELDNIIDFLVYTLDILENK